MKYHSALSVRKLLFVSRKFREKHAGVFGIIKAAMDADPASKWRLITRSEFNKRSAGTSPSMALTVSSDTDLLAPRRKFTGPSMLAKIARIDLQLTGSACAAGGS